MSHARYVRVWFVAGLAALALAIPPALVGHRAHVALLAAGIAYLSLSLALGLLPAFARRDWPTPLHAVAAVALGALALPFYWHERAFPALLGASLLVGAAQPAALLLSPRWNVAPDARSATDRAALGALLLALAAVGAGGLLLVAQPRGLPNAALAAILVGGALPAAFGALLFVLPRKKDERLRAATLAIGALVALALAAAGLAWALAAPLAADLRGPVAAYAIALGLGLVTLLRAGARGPLAAASAALAILSALALLLATLGGAPNGLLPVAMYAAAALALTLLALALLDAAPLPLPGRVRRPGLARWGAALLIAALFLYTPALQYARSAAPAAIVGAAGVALLVAALAPLARG